MKKLSYFIVAATLVGGLMACQKTEPVVDYPIQGVFTLQGTYDTSGASHVGIVVDPANKIMIHCGNPIQYASYDSNYWRQHFYCYGRIQ